MLSNLTCSLFDEILKKVELDKKNLLFYSYIRSYLCYFFLQYSQLVLKRKAYQCGTSVGRNVT